MGCSGPASEIPEQSCRRRPSCSVMPCEALALPGGGSIPCETGRLEVKAVSIPLFRMTAYYSSRPISAIAPASASISSASPSQSTVMSSSAIHPSIRLPISSRLASSGSTEASPAAPG